MPDDPFSKLGALDQKLYQPSKADPKPDPSSEVQPTYPPPAAVESKQAKGKPQVKPSKDLKKERSFERKKDLSKERTVVHHSFDVYEDQLNSLKKTALLRQIESGERVTVGVVIREALDKYFDTNDDVLKI